MLQRNLLKQISQNSLFICKNGLFSSLYASALFDFIHVDLIPDKILSFKYPIKGTLGMTHMPGVKWFSSKRDVDADIEALKMHYSTNILLSLVESWEFEHYGIFEITHKLNLRNIEHMRYEIVDMSVPQDMKGYHEFLLRVLKKVKAGKNAVVHCLAGLGRTGVFCATALNVLGYNSDEAIDIVRKHRRGTI